MQKVFDPSEPACFCPDALDEPFRALINALLRQRGTRRAGNQCCGNSLVGWRIGHAEQMFRSVGHSVRSGACSAGILPVRMPRTLEKSLTYNQSSQPSCPGCNDRNEYVVDL